MAIARLQSVVISFNSVKTVVIAKAAAASNMVADMQCMNMQWQSHLVYHYIAKQLDAHSMSLHGLHKLSSKHALLCSVPGHHGCSLACLCTTHVSSAVVILAYMVTVGPNDL